ncbi:hypothetical protein [Maribacter sp. ACAM166]|uniref:hypothetical protein n=1 Tax=Maribacter sp. ACAM166 TaxID=2508996 RepID=UPI0010FECF17|nr:hypothetical protein [Maribacter sp. ACAM166]TLP81347.1 hypothetical protein ES765_04895 [Maribacter sp. ACAM166]
MINYTILGTTVASWILIYFLIKRINRIEAKALIENRILSGRIQTLGKTAKEWDDSRKFDIKRLNATTLKATANSAGELIVTSPDGKTILNEFKLRTKK